MATKTSHLVSILMSMLLLLLFVSSQVGFTEARFIPGHMPPTPLFSRRGPVRHTPTPWFLRRRGHMPTPHSVSRKGPIGP